MAFPIESIVGPQSQSIAGGAVDKWDSRYLVNFRSIDTGLTVTALLDSQSPVLTGGYADWEVIDRPKRTGITRFKGKQPFRQDIFIVFDGVSSDENQEIFISRLIRMTQQPAALTDPEKITLAGTALRTDLVWIISNIDWDSQNTIWDIQDNLSVRLRQHAVVHLVEFVDDEVIITAPSPAVASAEPSTKITTPQGMTLKQVSMLVYGNPNKYLAIWQANRWLNPDPRALIPTGTVLNIPGRLKSFAVP